MVISLAHSVVNLNRIGNRNRNSNSINQLYDPLLIFKYNSGTTIVAIVIQ